MGFLHTIFSWIAAPIFAIAAFFTPAHPAQQTAAVVAATEQPAAQPMTTQTATTTSPRSDLGGTSAPQIIEKTTILTIPSSKYVTHDELTQQLAQLHQQFATAVPKTTFVSQNIAAGGNPDNPYAGQSRITNLTNVTVSGISGIKASEISDLSLENLGLSYATATDTSVGQSNTVIATWGDSLTAGNEDGTGVTYPLVLSTLSGGATYNGGIGGQTSAQIAARMLAATDKYSWPTIIWAGRNDGLSSASARATAKANIDSMVAALEAVGNYNYLILSVLNGSSEGVGTSAYIGITTFNNDLSSTYGSHYLDVRSYLVTQYDSNQAQDITDYADDIPPTSLRYDTLHLNAAGYTKLANYIYAHLNFSFTNSSRVLTVKDIAAILNPTNGYAQNGLTILTASTTTYSLAVGPGAGKQFTSSALYNTAVGYGALSAATSSDNNTAVGYTALTANTSGFGNTGVGYGALQFNLAGSNNTAMGNYALQMSTTSVVGSSAFGNQALRNTTTGASNSAFGNFAGFSNTIGQQNSVFGSTAFQNNTTGSYNSAFGASALVNNTIAWYNVAFGQSAMYYNTTGANNTGVGTYALQNNTTGSNNVTLGYTSLRYGVTTAGIVAIGVGAGVGNTGTTLSDLNSRSDTNMTFVGTYTSRDSSVASTTSLTNSAAIGYNAKVGCSNCMSLGNGVNVSIGTTTPYARLSVWGSDSASSTLAFNVVNQASSTVFAVFNGGNAQLSGTLTQSSDQRLKKDIESLDASSSLAAIKQLNPVMYNWIDPEKMGPIQYGFIAQDVQKVFPNLVSVSPATALTPDGTLGINYIGILAPLVKAVQVLATQLSDMAQNFVSAHIVVTTLDVDTANIANANIQNAVVQKLCVGGVCITQDQLKALLDREGITSPEAAAAVTSGGTSNDSSNATTTEVNATDTATSTDAIVSTDTQTESASTTSVTSNTSVSATSDSSTTGTATSSSTQ